MSVLACSRGDCRNVMCNRLSHDHGYICNACFNELVALGSGVNIDDFMASSVSRNYVEPDDSYETWDSEFPVT